MMNMQGRESFRSSITPHHPLRTYAVNSPRAKARLVVLALLADGNLDDQEMASLERRGVFADLGIAREDFVQVLYDFCSDVAGQLPLDAGSYELTPKTLDGLFSEINDREARRKLLQHIGALISSDGKLSDAEENLFRIAIDRWKRDVGVHSRQVFPELYYG